MNVNFEFLGNEPIENLITCIRYKIDKVVYFGYHETIELLQERTEKFLKDRCGVQSVVFHAVSHTDLESILNTLQREIQYEKSQGSRIYFDLTGGESLILLAFGMLSRDKNLSIHQFDIVKDRLLEFDDRSETRLTANVKTNDLPVTLDLLVEMQGGKINYKMHKDSKELTDPEFVEDVRRLFEIIRDFPEIWNVFSAFLRNVMSEEDTGLEVSRSPAQIKKAMVKPNKKEDAIKVLNRIVRKLEEQGFLQDVRMNDDEVYFRFKDRRIKNLLLDGGSTLELITCLHELKLSDECLVGVHLDWDGVIHIGSGADVLNEIDVLSRKGNIPTFISCKSGKMGSSQILFALYELNTVAKRFGGKYAKKVLVTMNGIGDIYKERAKEMGIEVLQLT